jgi:ABC-type tungstate transport system permease subunit
LTNITVTNNAFGKATSVVSTCRAKLTFVHTEEQREAAIKAGNAAAKNWIVWNNNYVASTHAVLPPPGGWAE